MQRTCIRVCQAVTGRYFIEKTEQFELVFGTVATLVLSVYFPLESCLKN